jgi:hypothetical protein
MPKMTVTKFLTSPEYGCATSAELIAFSRTDNAGFQTLKQWGKDEMQNRGIEIDAPPAAQ